MADETFKIGIGFGDRIHTFTVLAEDIDQMGEKENRAWKIKGDKGTLLISAHALCSLIQPIWN
jgi:hypothetical protein